jgi:hypothetical protein
MSPGFALLGLSVGAWAAGSRAVGTGGGVLPREGVVRVVFEDLSVGEVTLQGANADEPIPLAEARCTTGKDQELELCVFDLPVDVSDGVSALEAEGMSTSIVVGADIDIGVWSGTIEQVEQTLVQRQEHGEDADFIDLDTSWSAPEAPAAGYVAEFRDENGRVIDWLTVDPDSPSTLRPRTATEVLTPGGEICLQPLVFDPLDEQVWVGNRVCTDMPKQADPACRGCATPLGAAPLPFLLFPFLLARRRR